MIEEKVFASDMQKKDYYIRSCIYNRIYVVGDYCNVSRYEVSLLGREKNGRLRIFMQ